MRRLLLAAALLAAAAPGLAQRPRIVDDMAGTWRVLPVDGSPGCTIVLTIKAAGPERWVADPAPHCAGRVPAVAQIVAWRPEDGVQLLDAKGGVRVAFVEDETALLASPDLTTPTHYLLPGAAGITRVPQTADLTGGWTVARGRTSCAIVLKPELRGRTDTRGVAPGATCAGAARKLDHWWIEGLTLLIGGPDDLLIRLRPVDNGRFEGESNARGGAMLSGWTLIRPVRASMKVRP